MVRAVNHTCAAGFRLAPGGRLLDVTTGQGRRRLLVTPEGENLRVSYPGDRDELDLKIEADGSDSYRITGFRHGDEVELFARKQGENWELDGKVGNGYVFLAEKKFDERSGRLEGLIHDRRLSLRTHQQLDGVLIEGRLGSQRVSLRERELPGRGLNIPSILYLAPVLLEPIQDTRSTYEPGWLNVVV